MQNEELISVLIISGLFVSIGIAELLMGLYKSPHRFRQDWVIDLVSLAQLAIVLKPAAIFCSLALASFFWPSAQGALQGMPFWLGFLLVFLPDDFMHYWYHRFAHQHERMWPMHRTHHTPQQYQVTIAFRENWSWLFFMPGFWWWGLMIHLGLGTTVIVSATVIGVHNVLLHNGFKNDSNWYSSKFLGGIVRGIERIFNTPSLHRGHHGLGENGVPFGNYGQTLSIWDQLFGSITFLDEKRPQRYGVIAEDTSNSYQQLWWPFVR